MTFNVKPISPPWDKHYEYSEQSFPNKTFDSDSKTFRTIKKIPILRKLEILFFHLIFFFK